MVKSSKAREATFSVIISEVSIRASSRAWRRAVETGRETPGPSYRPVRKLKVVQWLLQRHVMHLFIDSFSIDGE